MKKILQPIIALTMLLALPSIFGQQIVGTNAVATQATSTTTGVTITGNSGVITTFTHADAAGTAATFTVTNTTCNANSAPIVNIVNYAGTTGTPVVRANNVLAGSFDIVVSNVHASAALNGVLKVGFFIP